MNFQEQYKNYDNFRSEIMKRQGYDALGVMTSQINTSTFDQGLERFYKQVYLFYMNAREKEFTVMGNETYTHEPHALINFGITSSQERENCPKIIVPLRKISVDEMPDHFDHASGAILSDPDWSIYMNDAWVLATVHAAVDAIEHGITPKSIYITLPVDFLSNPSPYVWDDKFNRVRVTGRELIGFTHFGYDIKMIKAGEHTFYQLEVNRTKTNQLKQANFLTYGEIMKQPAHSQKRYVINYILSCSQLSEFDFNGDYIIQDETWLTRVGQDRVLPPISRKSISSSISPITTPVSVGQPPFLHRGSSYSLLPPIKESVASFNSISGDLLHSPRPPRLSQLKDVLKRTSLSILASIKDQ